MQLSATEQAREDQQRRDSDRWKAEIAQRNGTIVALLTGLSLIFSGVWFLGSQSAREATAPMSIKIAKNDARIMAIEMKQKDDGERMVRIETKMDKIIDLIMELKK